MPRKLLKEIEGILDGYGDEVPDRLARLIWEDVKKLYSEVISRETLTETVWRANTPLLPPSDTPGKDLLMVAKELVEKLVWLDGRSAGRPTYVGDGEVRVGREKYSLTEREDAVLTTILFNQPLHLAKLVKKSGYPDASKIIAQIRRKYPKLARHIHSPGRRGKRGEYWTTIAKMPNATS